MKIAVIGTGKIGGTLGRALARAGHTVTFGSRHPEDAAAAGDSGAAVATVSAALDGVDAVVLALPANAVEDFLTEHGSRLDGLLVIDATNRMGGPVANAAAQITRAVPGVRYARAFNTLGWENFADPTFDGVAADLFFSAPQGDRGAVEEIVRAVGLGPIYLGEGTEDIVDGALRLWFATVQANGGNRRVAFRLLRG